MPSKRERAVNALREAFDLAPGTILVPVVEELIGNTSEPVRIEVHRTGDGLGDITVTDLIAARGLTCCTICGDPEPVHVHDENGERIRDYFVVGRGEDDFTAACRWKDRALRMEALFQRAALERSMTTAGGKFTNRG